MEVNEVPQLMVGTPMQLPIKIINGRRKKMLNKKKWKEFERGQMLSMIKYPFRNFVWNLHHLMALERINISKFIYLYFAGIYECIKWKLEARKLSKDLLKRMGY